MAISAPARPRRPRRRRRRPVLKAFVIVLAVAVLGAAALGAGAVWWSGVTLETDPAALARLRLQPLAGSIESVRASTEGGTPLRVSIDHGRVKPGALLSSGVAVRIEVVVDRPGWLAWALGKTRREQLTVRTPVAEVGDRWPTVSPGSPLTVRFGAPVDRVAWGRTSPTRTIAIGGSRVVSFGAKPPAGTIVVRSAARSWERLGDPVRVSWFPPTHGPAVQVSPAAANVSPIAPIRLTFARPVDEALGGGRPSLSPKIAGRWREPDSHTLLFEPGDLGYPLGADVRLKLPRTVSVVGTGKTRDVGALTFAIAGGSLLRLHQLLAQEGYLPVDWQPAGEPVARTRAAELKAAVDPPDGSFDWRYPDTPPQLQRLWSPDVITQITRGAVMMFEDEHGLTVDAFAGPKVWNALLADALAGKRRTDGYSYVYVHTHLPQLLTLWHNGKVVLTSPGNTGIPAAPTQPGTFPVFEHIPVGEMKGTNPDGTHYDDRGIRWISYFHGGEALHAFNRASFGTPQSLGCVELPLETAAKVWPYTPIGTLVTIEN
jgi:lipoprotein-anchoring transpeptidase ErfK/SrfK